jgi:hypothetical protein
MPENLEFLVSLKGGTESAAQMRALNEQIKAAGGQIRAVGSEAGKAKEHLGGMSGTVKKLAGSLVALGAGYAAWNAAKKALNFSKELQEGTTTLTKVTGLSTEASSKWVGVASAMGIPATALGTTFAKLSSAVEKQRKEGEKSLAHHGKESAALTALKARQDAQINSAERSATAQKNQYKAQIGLTNLREKQAVALHSAELKEQGGMTETGGAMTKLGITTKWLNENHKDFSKVLENVIEKVGKLPGETEKAAAMTQLFGRSWQTLSPLLLEGGQSMKEYLAAAEKYGVMLKGSGLEGLEKFRKETIITKLATEGLQLQFTKMALGPLSQFLSVYRNIVLALKTGKWNAVESEVQKLGSEMSKLVEKVVPKMAEGFAKAAPRMLTALWHGFQSASLGGEAVIAGVILTKLGLTSAIFGGAGKALSKAMATSIARDGVWATAGMTAGLAFELAFIAAAAYYFYHHRKEITESAKRTFAPGQHPSTQESQGPGGGRLSAAGKVWHGLESAGESVGDWLGLQHGGAIRTGGGVMVGERGPELLSLPPAATVTPLAPGAEPGWGNGDIVVQVSGKELARINRRETMQAQASGA